MNLSAHFGEMPKHKRFQNLTGMRYGRLLVIGFERKIKRVMVWNCLCECGKLVKVRASNLRCGNNKSCGCLSREISSKLSYKHGGTLSGQTPECRAWAAMWNRCTNKEDEIFYRYGGRGIIACDKWKDFENFLLDMGLRPSSNHSLDRINNDGNYEPSNCRWATSKQQQRNRSNNRILEFKGQKLILIEWAEKIGIRSDTLAKRLQAGWSLEKALFQKKRGVK